MMTRDQEELIAALSYELEIKQLRQQRDALLAALKDVYRHPHNLTTATLTMVGAAIKLVEGK